jgi:predicted alpha/beta hydrolase
LQRPIERQEHQVPTEDGLTLAATSYRAAGAPPREVAILLSAIGARQDRFEPLARHLAGDGWWVLTLDYRGIGRSAVLPEHRHLVSVRAWGEHDVSAIIRWVSRELTPRRLVAVGHSIGGQILPFSPEHRRLDAVAMISSQRGHWRLWSGWERYGVLLFFTLYVPMCLRLFGRLPLSLTGLENLERGVAEDWRRWGLEEEYLWPDGTSGSPRFAECTFPVLALSFEDDTAYAPRRAVEVLLRDCYVSAPVVWCHVEPEKLGLRGLGHSGFFDPQLCPRGWWDEVSAWLHTATPSAYVPPRRESAGGPPSLASIATLISRPGKKAPR